MEEKILVVDRHYNGVAKAMLSKQGIVLSQINEYNILKEFQRISSKENNARNRVKREQSSLSPPQRQGSP
jgi:hypothetical protein